MAAPREQRGPLAVFSTGQVRQKYRRSTRVRSKPACSSTIWDARIDPCVRDPNSPLKDSFWNLIGDLTTASVSERP